MKVLSSFFKLVLTLAMLVGLAGAGAAGLAVWYFGRDLPAYKQLADYKPPVATRVYAGDGRIMAEFAAQKRVFVPINSMPRLVIDAFLSAEDHNFFSHQGVDFSAIVRARLRTRYSLIPTDGRSEHRR